MSTAKMVADSTVPSDLPSEGRKRRKSCERKRNKKPKKSNSKELSKDVTSEDSDSDLDLSKDLLSIGGYIKERSEMVEQMFRVVRGPSLKRALPDILLDLSLDDLKQRCLEQLEIMSRKRILRILDGDIPAEISSSGTEDSSGEDIRGEEEAQPDSVTSSEQDQAEEAEEANESEEGSEEEEEIEEASEEEEMDAEAEDEEREQVSEDAESGEEGEGSVEEEEVAVSEEGEDMEEETGRDSLASENFEEEAAIEAYASEGDAGSGDVDESAEANAAISEEKGQRAPVLTKEQMEILELEMRARAIKAMLNKHPKTLIPLLPSQDTKTASQQTAKDYGCDIQDLPKYPTNTSKTEKHRSSKEKKASIHTRTDSCKQYKDKATKKALRKSTDSNDSNRSLSRETATPTNEFEESTVKDVGHDEEDSNSTMNSDSATVNVEPEDGEVASEGELNDDRENSNPSVLSEESEHSVDSSTAT